MTTYKKIQSYINLEYGYTAKTCWIAHMKEVNGLKPKVSPRRISETSRVHPCPEHKQADITQAFRHFKMI